MSQPVKLSDALVLDARIAGSALHRSIAGQVELWAAIGRAVEKLLQVEQVIALSQSGTARPISQCLQEVDTPAGRRRVQQFLAEGPWPRYSASPDAPGLLVATDEAGTRTVGRFVNRRFQPVRSKGRAKGKAR